MVFAFPPGKSLRFSKITSGFFFRDPIQTFPRNMITWHSNEHTFISLTSCCMTNYPQTYVCNTHLLFHGFCGLGVWAQCHCVLCPESSLLWFKLLAGLHSHLGAWVWENHLLSSLQLFAEFISCGCRTADLFSWGWMALAQHLLLAPGRGWWFFPHGTPSSAGHSVAFYFFKASRRVLISRQQAGSCSVQLTLDWVCPNKQIKRRASDSLWCTTKQVHQKWKRTN